MTNKQRQHLLAYLGYYHGPIDGDWGPLSQRACKAFQTDFGGIAVDGFGGQETDQALKQAVAGDHQRPESPQDWWQEITYFKPQETACKCGQHHTPYCDGYPHPMRRQTMVIADRARKHFGQPITIVSGLRCPRHNGDVGGVENSQHMYGEALDVHVRGVSQQIVVAWLLSQPDVRYAYAIADSSNVHFDIHPVGR